MESVHVAVDVTSLDRTDPALIQREDLLMIRISVCHRRSDEGAEREQPRGECFYRFDHGVFLAVRLVRIRS